MKLFYLWFLLPLVAAKVLWAAAPPATSFLVNGNFESDANADGWPDGWPHPNSGGSWLEENGDHFLHMVATKPGEMTMLYQPVNLPADTQALEMKWRWRVTNLKRGKQPWFDARIILNFKDGAGQKLNAAPSAPNLDANTDGWQERTIRFAVPAEARSLEWMPSLFQVESGALDLDDVSLIPIAASDVQTSVAPPSATQPTIGELAPEAAQPAKWPQELHVVGNQVKTKDGKTVWLQGLNVPSLEWVATGDHVLRSVQVAVDEWKSNIVRLPVKDDFWSGTGAGQKDGGAAYRELVQAAVNIVANRGAYVLLDLHRFRAPTDEHAKFWKEVATKYKNHPAVLFDVFNEPHDISWEVWRSGGLVEDKKRPADEDAFLAAAEKAKAAGGFRSPGMQGLVNAVRETGARNILVAGGLDWAYDLSGIAQGATLDDKGGNGLMYATHIYPWKHNWQDKVLVIAAKYPILVGEVGCDIQKMDFIPANQQENPYSWAPDMLGFIQKHRLHWTAWTFHTSATPRLIADWEYTPTPFWGAFVKAALLGGQFGLTKMR